MKFQKNDGHNLIWSKLIIRELEKNDCRQFYISPGLRNAPLIEAIKLSEKAKFFLGIDERAQAYRALGYAKATGRPAALVCTSGTALANYFPAIIEAKKSRIPLIILSADRPEELVSSGANQCIDQKHIFGPFVQATLNTGVPDLQYSPRALSTSMASTIWRANNPDPGPVHININFRDPLENDSISLEKGGEEYLNETQKLLQMEGSSSIHFKGEHKITIPSKIINHFNCSKRPLVVVGMLPPHLDKKPLRQFIEKLNCPFYLDITSGLKYYYGFDNGQLPSFDHPEVIEELEHLHIDFILHLGGALVSKHFYAMLEKNNHIPVVSLQSTNEKEDPSHSIHIKWNADIKASLESLQYHGEKLSWKEFPWQKWHGFINEKRKIIDSFPLSFPSISKTLVEFLPEETPLFIGNSTAIRSFDSYTNFKGNKNLPTFANRGVSGIEGQMACALGVSEGLKKDVTLVLGDISFLHDLNSLQLLKESSSKVIVIIVNNYGGGIFRLLPVKETILPELTTPHQYQFTKACELFQLPYRHAQNREDLKKYYLEAKSQSESFIIEVSYDEEHNNKLYQYLKTIKL